MDKVYSMPESKYELERNKRIKENNEMIKAIFGENVLEQWSDASPTVRKKPFERRKQRTGGQSPWLKPVRRNPKRNARSYPTEEDDYVREESDGEGESTSPNRLVVRWIGPLTKKCRLSSVDAQHESNSDAVGLHANRRSRKSEPSRPRTPRVVLSVSDITEEDLLLVADSTSDKQKDPVNGTTCHQCRQKTGDLKTICRNESCIGIRGQFCGPCLRNRYGESVREALLDPEWSCPPCRDICNCSFCMVKRGRRCTGQLIGIARQNGFKDVRSFLGD